MKNRKECIDRREIREAREILAIVNWKRGKIGISSIYNRIHLTKELKKWGQDQRKNISDLHEQQQELDAVIADMVQ